MSPFLKSEQIDKSPHKTSVSKNKTKQNPNPNQTQDTETSFETFPELLPAQNLEHTDVPNWFDGTGRGAAQGSFLGECFLEELL